MNEERRAKWTWAILFATATSILLVGAALYHLDTWEWENAPNVLLAAVGATGIMLSLDVHLYLMVRHDLPDRLWPPHAKWMRKQGGDGEC